MWHENRKLTSYFKNGVNNAELTSTGPASIQCFVTVSDINRHKARLVKESRLCGSEHWHIIQTQSYRDSDSMLHIQTHFNVQTMFQQVCCIFMINPHHTYDLNSHLTFNNNNKEMVFLANSIISLGNHIKRIIMIKSLFRCGVAPHHAEQSQTLIEGTE